MSATELGITTIINLSYEQAVEQTIAALKEQGFGAVSYTHLTLPTSDLV